MIVKASSPHDSQSDFVSKVDETSQSYLYRQYILYLINLVSPNNGCLEVERRYVRSRTSGRFRRTVNVNESSFRVSQTWRLAIGVWRQGKTRSVPWCQISASAMSLLGYKRKDENRPPVHTFLPNRCFKILHDLAVASSERS